MSYLLVGAGLLLLFVGGELMVRGSIALALTFGVSKLVVAVILVGFGTSAPEVLVSVESAILGYPQLALGNAVGSNIANILLIVGVSAAIYPIVVERSQVRRDTWYVLGITAAFSAAGLLGEYTIWHGLVMVTALGLYIADSYWRARRVHTAEHSLDDEDNEDDDAIAQSAELSVVRALVFAVGGLVMLILGADMLVDGAVGIAHRFGISEAIIGLTVVAVGTSLPELAICASAARRREPLVAVGNVLGSNIFNLLGAMGVVALISDVGTARTLIAVDLVIMAVITACLAVLLLHVNRIGRTTGICFVGAYVLYLAGQFGVI
jgi:cation:H+ antiporter